jgi:hypothetical protein
MFGLTSSRKVGRMMMNIRGLIMDDSKHTVHLQALQFINADSNFEEDQSYNFTDGSARESNEL